MKCIHEEHRDYTNTVKLDFLFLESKSSFRYVTSVTFFFLYCLTLENEIDRFPETSVNNLRQVTSQKSEVLGVKKIIAVTSSFHISYN